MKALKTLFVLLVFSLLSFSVYHKYYISVTQINYIQEQKAIQITSRVFINDFEQALRKKYNDSITLAYENEAKSVNTFIEQYLNDKIHIQVNNQDMTLHFIGKEYDGDVMRCYIEIEQVETVKTFKITNELLFDTFKTQQNIVKTKFYSKNKSEIQTAKNHNTALKFN